MWFTYRCGKQPGDADHRQSIPTSTHGSMGSGQTQPIMAKDGIAYQPGICTCWLLTHAYLNIFILFLMRYGGWKHIAEIQNWNFSRSTEFGIHFLAIGNCQMASAHATPSSLSNLCRQAGVINITTIASGARIK